MSDAFWAALFPAVGLVLVALVNIWNIRVSKEVVKLTQENTLITQAGVDVTKENSKTLASVHEQTNGHLGRLEDQVKRLTEQNAALLDIINTRDNPKNVPKVNN